MRESRRERSPAPTGRDLAEETTTLPRLFAALAEGEAEALEGIYDAVADELHGLAAWRTGSGADAADVVQDVFVRLASLGPRLAQVRDPRAWLRRVTHRIAVDVHRRRARRAETTIDEAMLVAAPLPGADRELEARRVSERLLELPPAQREAIYLRCFCGCSFAELGRATGVPTFTAASRFRLGMKRLRRSLGVRP